MRIPLTVLLLAAGARADTWSLERLFTRPFIWGTRPDNIRWSKKGRVLGFLWNSEGGRFLDLYTWHADRRQLVRVTRLETLEDPLNRTQAEKDDRQKHYLPPPEGLADYDLSADGTRAVFSYRGDLWVARTDGSTSPFRLTRTRTAETAPQFSPDGRRIAYAREGQVFVQDIANGQLSQVTELETGDDGARGGPSLGAFRWSPDGARILYAVRASSGRRLLLPNFAGRLVTAAPFSRTLPGDEPVESSLYVVSFEGGAPKLMEAGPWGGKAYAFGAPQWSRDSRHILLSVIHSGLKQLQILVWDAGAGKASVVNQESDAAWVASTDMAWSPDSRQVVFTSERSGYAHLNVVGLDGGKPNQITQGAWEVSNERGLGHELQWAGGYVYFASTESGTAERHYYRIRPDGTGKQRLSQGEGVHTGVVSENGNDVALLSGGPKQPMDLFAGGERVTTSPRPDFAKYPWPEMRFFDFPSHGDGKTVAGKMTLPPGYDPTNRSRQWPAVFFIHGSGYATSILRQWGAYQQERFVFNSWLANHGYVVFDLDYRGSSGYGRGWRTGVYLHMGGKDLDDVLGAVDHARKLGNIDMQRIGIWGSSYGGFMTNMAMFLSPETFRAGAAFSAVNDWENYNAFYTQQRLGKPQEYPEAYRRSSPIHFSFLLRHPLLLVHGMVDNNVMFQDAVQLAEKLIHEGKPFEQAYYPEESHIFERDETLSDAFRRAAEFFDRNLK
jgi:dipeptidyl aminopeptidase/acylaminoacyl peptidase